MGHKEIQRQNTIDEIKGYARSQMAKAGPGGISMSAIARSMEISSPALYRYFDSRDELIKALISDTLGDIEKALGKAKSRFLPTEYARRFWEMSEEYRVWALEHPKDFFLIFASPSPEDSSCQTLLNAGLTRVFHLFLEVLEEAYHNGILRPFVEDTTGIDKGFPQDLRLGVGLDRTMPYPVIYTGLVAWSRIHGLVMLELAQGGSSHQAQETIYRQEVARIMSSVGLELSPIEKPIDDQPQKMATSIKRSPPVTGLHVVFGSDPLGFAVMRELLSRGRQVRMVSHSENDLAPEGVEWMVGDIFQAEFARKACQNAMVVYQCIQPPNGDRLEQYATLNAAILDGAAAKGARFVYGDNCLAYGVVEGPIHEGMANKPATRRGLFHVRVVETILTAHRSGRVRAVIGRGSEVFGPQVLHAAVGRQFIVPLLQGKAVAVIGSPDIAHTFTFIDDFGKALVELGEREEAAGQIWHVPNAPALTQRQFAALFCEEAGLPLKIKSLSRPELMLLSLFSSAAFEKREILYQFEKPFMIDSNKFERAFQMTATPLPEAVRTTVRWFRDYLK